jgi:hypothetical protein
MNSTEARERLRVLVEGGNVNPIRNAQNRSRDFNFCAASGKHNAMTEMDWRHLRIYVEAALRSGSSLECHGIPLRDGTFLEMDRAKIGAAITDSVLESSDGNVLSFTEAGWLRFMQTFRA